MIEQHIETKSRLIAKIVWEILKRESFESMADLTEALKCRLAHFHIRWTNDEISDAYRLVGSSTQLFHSQPVMSIIREPDPDPMTREEAARLHREIMARYETEHPRPTIRPFSLEEW